MQLKKPKPIRQLLTAATSSLLAGTVCHAQGQEQIPWQVDSALLYYSEKNRVTVFEPVVAVRKDIGDEQFVGVRLVLDSMTGASPNGAIPLDTPQTFTTPSGNATFTTPAGETPLDNTYRDFRAALSAEWETPLSEHLKTVIGGNYSQERDYSSLGASLNLAWDLNKRNTTLATGISMSHDQVNAVGYVPVGLSAVPTQAGVQKNLQSKGAVSKDIKEWLLGVTQVLGPRTLLQFNFTLADEQGYLTDPYKILSVLDNSGQLRSTDPYLYEKRPDSRRRQALYFKLNHQFGADVVQAGYRYYEDDWGIISHTYNLHYRYEFTGGRHYLQPHLRYYLQSKADFYHYSLQSSNMPAFASADYRLGDMSTTTLGLKYGMVLGDSHEFGTRLESMQQKAEGDAPFTDNTAIILQLDYSFLF